MAQQYIMQLEGVTKVFEQKEILKDIWLSFFPGAKIGVLGVNGAGKSTLLKIMSGKTPASRGMSALPKASRSVTSSRNRI